MGNEIYNGKLKYTMGNGATLTGFQCGEESRERHIHQPEENSSKWFKSLT